MTPLYNTGQYYGILQCNQFECMTLFYNSTGKHGIRTLIGKLYENYLNKKKQNTLMHTFNVYVYIKKAILFRHAQKASLNERKRGKQQQLRNRDLCRRYKKKVENKRAKKKRYKKKLEGRVGN